MGFVRFVPQQRSPTGPHQSRNFDPVGYGISPIDVQAQPVDSYAFGRGKAQVDDPLGIGAVYERSHDSSQFAVAPVYPHGVCVKIDSTKKKKKVE